VYKHSWGFDLQEDSQETGIWQSNLFSSFLFSLIISVRVEVIKTKTILSVNI